MDRILIHQRTRFDRVHLLLHTFMSPCRVRSIERAIFRVQSQTAPRSLGIVLFPVRYTSTTRTHIYVDVACSSTLSTFCILTSLFMYLYLPSGKFVSYANKRCTLKVESLSHEASSGQARFLISKRVCNLPPQHLCLVSTVLC